MTILQSNKTSILLKKIYISTFYSTISWSTELEQSNQCLKTDESVIDVPTLDFARKDIKS